MTASTLRARVAGVLVALVALAGLSACTPADRPLAALRYADGRPVLLIVSCPDFNPDRISVYQEGASPSVGWSVDAEGAAVPEQVRLLEPPAGWTVSEKTLDTLVSGVEYGVAVYGGEYDAVPIHFTIEEVAALQAGQVLIGQHQSKRKAVPESTFRDKAKDSC